ncbi:hypothetical protein V6Z11_D01G094800 [Gossypium hirsutum]
MILLVQSVKAICLPFLVLSSLDFSFLRFLSDLLADLQGLAFSEFWWPSQLGIFYSTIPYLRNLLPGSCSF